MKTIVCLILLVASPANAGAGSSSRQTTKLDTGLVIVPFAVPVAVPVATVRQPSVLYSYRGYATPPAAIRAPSPAAQPVSDAAALLTQRCAACHTGAQAQGNVVLFDESGQLLTKLPRRRILEAVEAGRMPQPLTVPRLTTAEIDVLRNWAQPPRDLEY